MSGAPGTTRGGEATAAARLAALTVGGTALLAWAQHELDGADLSLRGGLLGAVGVAAWVLALRRWRWPRHVVPPTSRAPVRGLPLALALGAAAATWHLSADGVYTRSNLLTWAIAVGSWLWALWPRATGGPDVGRVRKSRVAAASTAAAIVAVVAIGAFFRFHDLTLTPGEPTSDHAEKLLDIADVRSGENPVFFPRNTGREPLQFYVTAGLVEAGLPPTFDTLKLGTALVGTLGVLAVLLLAWELWGRLAGIVAATLFAVGQWPVTVARDGLRPVYGATAAAVTLWLLVRYLGSRRRRELLLLGAAMGIGLHGYTAFRIVVVFALAVVAAAAVTGARQERRRLWDPAILLGTVAMTSLPLLRYAADHPDRFWYRTLRRVGGSEAPIGGLGDQLQTLVTNVWHAALAFNWRGESGVVTVVQFDPFLDAVAGGAFVAGVLAVGHRALRGRDARAGVVLAALPVLSLASSLNLAFPHENPSATRMAPVSPAVFAVAALPLCIALTQVAALPRRRAALAAAGALAAAAGALSGAANYTSFFRDFDRQYRASYPNTSEAAAAIERSGVPRERAYMLPFPYWIDDRNVGAALGDITWAETNVVAAGERLPAPGGGRLVFLLNDGDAAGRARLKSAYPEGSYRRIRSAVGKDFGLFSASARQPR